MFGTKENNQHVFDKINVTQNIVYRYSFSSLTTSRYSIASWWLLDYKDEKVGNSALVIVYFIEKTIPFKKYKNTILVFKDF